MDVRLRGYDGISFANFYKQKQMELFSALDNAFAAKAENALADYDAVKKVDIQLQTRLGNRKGQIAAQVIGAFSHSHNYAFGWQVRAYSGESKTKGANAGIFWRRVEGESLYGVNVFGDYEKGEYGEFVRYSIGGELQNAFVSFAANYYVPITDERSVNSTLIAFSREGYDANLRINIPPLDSLKVAADYYHYDGKYDLAADDGFRYGIEWHPSADLRLGVFYDDGGEEFGGDIVYVYNIAAPAKRESKTAFAPDLFAPVQREHSQRIAIATIGAGAPSFGVITRYVQINNTTPIATLHIPASYFVNTATIILSSALPVGELMIADNRPMITISYTPSAAGVESIITIIAQGIIGTSLNATAFVITVSSFAGFAAAFDNPPNQSFITGAIPGTVGMVSGMGGVLPYSYRASSGDGVMVNSASGLVLFDISRERTITANIAVADSDERTPNPVLTLILTAFAGAIVPGNSPFVVGVQSPAATIVLPNGRVDGSLPGAFAIMSDTIILFSAAMVGITPISITVTNAAQTVAHTIMLTAQAATPIGGSFSGYHSQVFITGFNGTVGTMMVSGGHGSYSYSNIPSDFSVDSNGVIRFMNAAAITVSATIVANDQNEHTLPFSIAITVSAFSGECGFIDGCAQFSFSPAANTPTSPGLAVATMMAHAGVNVSFEQTNINSDNSRQGIISQYVYGVVISGLTPQEFADIVKFLIDYGADINYQRNGGGFTGQTARDNDNGLSRRRESVLDLYDARCDQRCDIGDLDRAGQICTRPTGGAHQVPAGSDCRP